MSLQTRTLVVTLFVGAAAICSVNAVYGDFSYGEITYGGQLSNSGLGFGNKCELMTLQGHGGAQSGSMLWNGTTPVPEGDVITNKSELFTFSELWTQGIRSSDFLLLLDLNQSNRDTDIESISLDFYNPVSPTPQFSICGGTFTGLDGGQGNSNWDHFFNVTFGTVAGSLFDDPQNGDWLTGIRITSMTAAAGPDVFGLSHAPEPSTIGLWSVMGSIASFLAWRKLRRARGADC